MSNFKTHSVEIDGKTVVICLLPTLAGIKMSQKLVKFALPAYAQFISILQGKGDIKDAVAGIMANIDELELATLVKELLDSCTIDEFPVSSGNQPLNYFQGQYDLLIDVVIEALKANFGKAFAKVSAVLSSTTE